MKKTFKKISAIGTSMLLTGMTLGVVSAANYPAPFVENGMADVAIVYGTGANVNALDEVQATNILENLKTKVTSTSKVTVSGGESFALDKSSNHFNFNDALSSVYSTLDNEDMTFLADGTYDDGDIDEDYEQTITLSSATSLTLFADNDYNNDEPTVGFKFDNGDTVLSYEMKYDDAINFSEMEDTDLPLMGGEYYVLEANSATNTLELLDSAEKSVLSEGETATIGGKSVSIEYISATEVKFSVDGETTDKLADHDSYELNDGSYIVANEVLYSDKEGSISKVEFSIGKGLMKIVSGDEIEINDEDVDELYGTFTKSSDQLTKITITWKSNDETYLTQENAIAMPGFEKITLAYGGLDYADDSEKVSLDNGDTLVLNMDNYDLDVMWYNATLGNATLGTEDYTLITATAANATVYAAGNYTVGQLTGGLELAEDNRFIVTRIKDDLSDAETLHYEVSKLDFSSLSDFTVELKDLINDNDLTFDDLEEKDRGDITVTLTGISATTAYFKFDVDGSTTNLAYNKAVSEKGLVVNLPTSSPVDVTAGTALTFTEANDDEDVDSGVSFTATVKVSSNEKLHASTFNATVVSEEQSDDKYIGYVESPLTSKVSHDTSGDEYDFSVEYFGKEVTADVQVATGAVSVTEGTSVLGEVLVLDSEVASVKDKNLIIVGGSCINSAAATLLGGSYCGEAFTAATGVAADQFVIKGYADSSISNKLALLVAGYEAQDTVNAATYLRTKDVDTSMEYKGTSSTSAELVVETA